MIEAIEAYEKRTGHSVIFRRVARRWYIEIYDYICASRVASGDGRDFATAWKAALRGTEDWTQ
jgi:hypothetical protein